MTEDGKQMSFDANARTKSNLLSSLLDDYKNELVITNYEPANIQLKLIGDSV